MAEKSLRSRRQRRTRLQSAAAADATQKANAAQSAAEATATSQRNEMATKLGYDSYDAMVQAAEQGQTIIDGGYLRTALIDVQNILTEKIELKGKGAIYGNFDGIIDENGIITSAGNTGFAIDHAGNAYFNNGVFNGIVNASGGVFKGLISQGCNFYIAARIMIKKEGESWKISSNNDKYNSFIRLNTGRYAIPIDPNDRKFGIPRVICHYCSDKYETSLGNPTLDGIATNSYHPGHSNALYQINCRSGLNVFQTLGPSTIEYIPLYFTDNNNDDFIDPVYCLLTLIYI